MKFASRRSLSFVATGCLLVSGGCSSLRLGQTPASPATSSSAANSSTPIARQVSYIEDRYRELPSELKKEKPSGLDALSPSNMKAGFKEMIGKGPNPSVARQLLAEAELLYEQATNATGTERAEKFSVAAAKYLEAAERWPESLLEEDALFHAGEGYFFSDEYPKANAAYEKLVKQHPNTRYMDLVDAHRFAIAQYWLDLDKADKETFYSLNLTDKRKPWYDTDGYAFRVYDRIRIDDPTGKLADDATIAAANAHFEAGRYIKADDLYTDLRKSFPSSEHQFLAHYLGLKTKLMTYLGPDYAGDSLDEAEKIVKQIRRQFPVQAEKEKEFINRSYAEIRFRKAERLFTMGKYHELRAEYGAANHYLQQILKNYSDTPFAEQARERIAENATKPELPPQNYDWFVNLFPQRQVAKPLLKTDDPVTAKKGKR